MITPQVRTQGDRGIRKAAATEAEVQCGRSTPSHVHMSAQARGGEEGKRRRGEEEGGEGTARGIDRGTREVRVKVRMTGIEVAKDHRRGGKLGKIMGELRKSDGGTGVVTG